MTPILAQHWRERKAVLLPDDHDNLVALARCRRWFAKSFQREPKQGPARRERLNEESLGDTASVQLAFRQWRRWMLRAGRRADRANLARNIQPPAIANSASARQRQRCPLLNAENNFRR